MPNWFKENASHDSNDSAVFENEQYLSTDYIPDELLFREDEMEKIYSNFEKPFRGRLTRHMLINGPPGTGKTHASKKVRKEFNEVAKEEGANFEVLYVSSEKKTYYQLLIQLGQKIDNTIPMRGIGTGEIQDRILKKIQMNGKKYIVIFDEIDRMIQSEKKDTDPIQDIVKFVTRAHESIDSGNGNNSEMIGVFIGNKQGIRERVAACSAATSSSFHPKKVYFRGYNAEEIQKIISHRCDKAFKESFFKEASLAYLASQIRSHSFDLRFGFEVLRQCGDWLEEGDVEEVDENVIEDAICEVQSNNIEEIISEMNDTKLMTLWAILYGESNLSNDKKVDGGITTKHFYDLYKRASEHVGLKKRSQAHITQNVASSLETEGLISTKVKGMGRGRGKTIVFYSAEIEELTEIIRQQIKKRYNIEPILEKQSRTLDSYETPA